MSLNSGEYKTKTEIAYSAIREAIISGMLLPGARIVIKEIAEELGTSEIPVREAIRLLEAEGLVEAPPHMGPRVTKISRDDIADMLPVRAALEAYATKLVCERMSAGLVSRDLLSSLSETLREMEIAVEQGNTAAYGQLNRRFHLLIYDSCGNEYLKNLIVTLWENTERARSLFAIIPEILATSLREHKQLKELLEDCRCSEIGDVAYNHKIAAFNLFLDRLSRESGGGD